MRRTPLVLGLAAATLALPALSTTASAGSDTTRGEQRVCAHAPAGFAACDAHVRTKGGQPDATTNYTSGFRAEQLKSAYGLTGLDGATTVAVVDAYAHPNAAADLAKYRSEMHLGTAKLTQYSQTGSGRLARADVGWGQEEMLDLEMVSAICPSCPILYVGAKSASFSDLSAAVKTAAAKHAKVISNSYGGSEYSGETSIAPSYNIPGVAITVSSGDNGYGVEIPAAFNTVTAVGGTSLVLNADGTRTETVWGGAKGGAGSGCSAYISKPTAWQADKGCSNRTVSDVSAVADPATGVAVYDSYGSNGGANWLVFGGTSVAAPMIGGIYGLTGVTASPSGIPAQNLYSAKLYDVIGGSNGSCGGTYLCTGVTGYDGPTGVGSPIGLAGF